MPLSCCILGVFGCTWGERADLIGKAPDHHDRIHQSVNRPDTESLNDAVGEMLNEDGAKPIAVGIGGGTLRSPNLDARYPTITIRFANGDSRLRLGLRFCLPEAYGSIVAGIDSKPTNFASELELLPMICGMSSRADQTSGSGVCGPALGEILLFLAMLLTPMTPHRPPTRSGHPLLKTFLSSFALVQLLSGCSNGLDCDVIDVKELVSPGGRHVATVYGYTCYDTTGHPKYVDLRRSGKKLQHPGNVLVTGVLDEVSAEWMSATQLMVKCYFEGGRPPPMTTNIDGVEVSFEEVQ